MKSESKSRYATKKPGKTEVEPLRRYEDMYNLMEYFKSRKMWDSYLTFMFGLLLGRRIGDTVMVKWSDFYYENGSNGVQGVQTRLKRKDRFESK